MKITPKANLGRRQGTYVITLAGSIRVSVGGTSTTESDVSRGFPSMRTIHKCDDGKSYTGVSKPNFCDLDGRIVSAKTDTLLKGYSTGKDASGKENFIYLTEEELDEVKARFASNEMKMLGITKIEGGLKPWQVLDSVVLLPALEGSGKSKARARDEATNEKFYALLADSLATSESYIIGKIFTVRGEYFVAIGGISGPTPVLMQFGLYYGSELRDFTTPYTAPNLSTSEKELMTKVLDKARKDVDYGSVTSQLREVFDDKIKNRKENVAPSTTDVQPTAVAAKETSAEDLLKQALGS